MNSLEVFYCFSTTHCDTKRYDLHVHVPNIEFLHNFTNFINDIKRSTFLI